MSYGLNPWSANAIAEQRVTLRLGPGEQPAGKSPKRDFFDLAQMDIPVVVGNGIEVTADFSGWSPGFVSLVQVNFRLPPDLPPGQCATVKLRYGQVSTQQLTLAVE